MTCNIGTKEGLLLMNQQVQNDSNEQRTAKIVVGLGDDFESANAAVMYHARGIVSTSETGLNEQLKDIDEAKKDVESAKMWAENWYDGLTYCRSIRSRFSDPLRLTLYRHLECAWPTTY
jgi:hypothetical protein